MEFRRVCFRSPKVSGRCVRPFGGGRSRQEGRRSQCSKDQVPSGVRGAGAAIKHKPAFDRRSGDGPSPGGQPLGPRESGMSAPPQSQGDVIADKAQLVEYLEAGCKPADAWRIGRSEEHTSELQSLMRISYAVFCLKKKNKTSTTNPTTNHKQPITIQLT